MLADSLFSAFDRLADFVEVQGPHLAPESVDLLQAAAGITEDERRVIADASWRSSVREDPRIREPFFSVS